MGTLYFDQAYEKDAEIGKWLANREFRIALSHGVDREQINEAFALGIGVIGSAEPAHQCGQRRIWAGTVTT